ncbi:SCO family protein [Saccharophagus sp. K07]|jgi:protein SCO1/2|uniref:SCO family protein n=1 Tax=Saccharophagus sp. K07 TaxID=2283636 RepID=UPI001651C282|nr:SCO family protein [Saccharophagus sp. K07]MBC6906184.1 SCO family protein [Saccharophagus sp. K07]
MSAPVPSELQQRNILRTVGWLVFLILVVIALFLHKFFSPRVMSPQELSINGAVVFEKPRIIPPFELVDHTGAPFTLERLQGKWTVIFFGFTTCPDICPTTLATLSQWYKKLDGDIKKNTQVVMLTVDPARDTAEKLSAYMKHFDPDFIGVTGEFLPIKTLTDQLNVAFNKVVIGEDYTVDHSGHLVLINPYGHYHGIFKPPFQLGQLKSTYQSIVVSFRH